MFQRGLDQLCDVVVVEPVIRDAAIFSGCDEPKRAQKPELVTGCRFGLFYGFSQIANAEFANPEGTEQFDAGGFRDRFQEFCRVFEQMALWNALSGGLNHFRMDAAALGFSSVHHVDCTDLTLSSRRALAVTKTVAPVSAKMAIHNSV